MSDIDPHEAYIHGLFVTRAVVPRITASSRVDKFSKDDIIVSPSILSANFSKLGEQVCESFGFSTDSSVFLHGTHFHFCLRSEITSFFKFRIITYAFVFCGNPGELLV